jgi:hypothetical protein
LTSLSSKLESFIQMMRQDKESARHGFNLLTKRPEPEQYFDALDQAGFFDPENNSGPVPSTEPGFVQIPFWSALNYLEAVAKRASERDDDQLANKLLKVVRDVTNYRDPDGAARDNYHTYHKFADFLGLLPLRTIKKEDIHLVSVWLASKFDHGLVGSSLGKGLLKRLLASGSPEDIEKACLLMKECMAFRWLPEEDKRGREPVTAIDDYWLKQIVDKYAKELGAKAGLPAVEIFEEGLREIFGDPRRRYGSTLWRPAIETNQQNLDFRGPENRFVEGMRDSLAGWIEVNPTEAAAFVTNAFADEEGIVRRIAIHTTTENFGLLRDAFQAVIGPKLFSSGHRHELYRLLREQFAALSASGKEAVISALRALPKPTTGEDPERRLKYTQREWLTAIKDQPEASGWYADLSTDPALGSPTDHPDFLSYHEMQHGPGPTPFGEESLIAFAEDGSIVDRLNEFKEMDSWKGPTLGGLVAALEAAVASSPNMFLPLLSAFHDAKLPFQYALLAGFKRVFDPSNEPKPEFDWNIAWPKLMTFFSECLSDPAFWSGAPEENVNLIPNRTWMTTLIAGFLEAGTKNDETAYAPELLPKGWQIITTLLARAADEEASLTNPMTHALNTEKGRVIGAMYNHALRVCRVAKQRNQSIAGAWASVQDAFDAEIAKCRNANFEFSTLSASYIANLDYMSHDWLVANVKRLFPSEFPVNFKVALGGLAYATPTRPIYQLLSANGVFENAFKTKVEDSYSKGRITEWICLAYLWGDENLESPLIAHLFAAGLDDLQTATEFFWGVHHQKPADDQVERILAFWTKCLEWSKAQKDVPVLLLSRLSRLTSYLKVLDARAKELLLAVVPYVHRDYSTHEMIKELARLVDSNPTAAAEVLERMLDANAPNDDMDDKLKGLIQKLAAMGLRAEAIRCVEKLRKSLPDMSRDLYKQLLAGARETSEVPGSSSGS